jgi:undecaprenyl-diphosphatase
MLIVDEFMHLDMSAEFKEMFFILIQLGAVAAVLVLFWGRMLPFEFDKGIKLKKQTLSLWLKVAVACIPGEVVTLLFDDVVETYLHTPAVIASALLFYGFAFILIELKTKERSVKTQSLEEITYKDALLIGLFQVLSIIPGTSRSGATILGARLLGLDKKSSTEFSFFAAVPAILGASFLKIIEFSRFMISAKATLSFQAYLLLAVAFFTAFAVSVPILKLLISFLRGHSFIPFGIYRIILGITVFITL